ncbi:hydantoinase/oxoprolinase family protein [Mesorhizobium retamae]|uniref:Hydantoinase/oxoprolinase family protein n=1 Tax=Mesorhizobium retamae TaxID=2912854 RepID=A0ABS9QK76_9HYPH|nr:hydantoinase/oxoprolinase family protein [Mesorhizobium sp. IRAMC:0171]MCG7507835.1 hydantoinase/oxoprolinase family protein [Mesorhizobium sp. IRAMC:0171]
MTYAIGVDTGGTFTDGFLASTDGMLVSAKAHSTPPDFSRGFINVLGELASAIGSSVEELLSKTEYIVHGTTSTLNAVITGEVARVGFLTTRGHGDSIRIMNLEGRYAGLDPSAVQNISRTNKPAPLVPYRDVIEIDERIDHKGAVIVPLDEQGVRAAVRKLYDDGVRAIAVSLLWAFRNPVHERRIREIVQEEAAELYVALSHETSPRIREYTRSATTIINTQIGPVLKGYLAPLEEELRAKKFDGSLLIMQGSGGCVQAADASKYAVGTLGSVLTGGIVGCLRLAERLGHRNIISTDMGGTTFLAGLVRDGKPSTTTTTVLHQHQINTAMVDVRTIGAGGGAIAWIDGGGNLRVGPRSAGARPGPVCYGEGGHEPTVTDADLVLGIINGDNFLGGRKKLSKELAAEAIRTRISEPLGLTMEQGAAAIYAIQNAQTADLVRSVVVNGGHDPRDFVLYSFGGAGPVHAVSYSADLGVSEVVVPLGSTAAVFSAYGLASSDIVLTAEMSDPSNFPVDPVTLNGNFEKLEAELAERLIQQKLRLANVVFEREAELRYTMQMAEVTTPVPGGMLGEAEIAGIGASFEQLYERIYGKGAGFSDAGLQIITYRVRAVGILPIRPDLAAHERAITDPVPSSIRKVFLDTRKGWQDTAIYDYRALGSGSKLSGPAVIEAPTTTVALPEGFAGVVDTYGNLIIRVANSG